MGRLICIYILLAFTTVCTVQLSMRTVEPRVPGFPICNNVYRSHKIGCFKEQTGMSLISTYRDRSSAAFGGMMLNWRNFPTEIMRMVCDCKKRAKKAGYKLFSIRFWAECWAGHHTTNIMIDSGHVIVDNGGISREGPTETFFANSCVNKQGLKCMRGDLYCVGTVVSEFIYTVASSARGRNWSTERPWRPKTDDRYWATRDWRGRNWSTGVATTRRSWGFKTTRPKIIYDTFTPPTQRSFTVI